MKELEIEGTKVAVAQESPIGFLGALVWYSVSEMYVPFDALEEALQREGVPKEAWPHRTRPIDAFKAAVRSVQSKDFNVEYETYVDPTGVRRTDSHTMLVVQRVHDQAIDALPVAMKVRYDERSETLTFEPTGRVPPTVTATQQARIGEMYEKYRTCYTSEDFRTLVSGALRRAYASVQKRSGGIYFVPEQHRPNVEPVARVVDSFFPGADMVATPVIDREPERKTILKRYEKATLERIQELMTSVREIVRKGEKVIPSSFGRYREEMEYLRAQKKQYESLLNDAMARVDVEMDVLESDLTKMSGLVED